MKRITIGGKEYTFKFSVAASLYHECTETILDGYATSGKVSASARENDSEAMIKDLVTSMANIPTRASILFYSGLLEYHGKRGDGSINSLAEAEDLLVDYLEEKQDENGNWTVSFADVLAEMMEIMYEDNFFALIGLNKVVSQAEEPAENKPKRRKRSKVGESTSTN